MINFVVGILNSTFSLLPREFQPDSLLGLNIPGIGMIITLLVIFLTGMLAANFLGSQFVTAWDNFIGKIPLVRTIHAGVKQVLQTLFTPGGQSFRKVLLVEYPRRDMWTVAFQTSDMIDAEIAQAAGSEPMMVLYVPTTPNPTSGFLLLVPRKDVVELNMTVDQALKFVISLGVMQPNNHSQNPKVQKI